MSLAVRALRGSHTADERADEPGEQTSANPSANPHPLLTRRLSAQAATGTREADGVMPVPSPREHVAGPSTPKPTTTQQGASRPARTTALTGRHTRRRVTRSITAHSAATARPRGLRETLLKVVSGPLGGDEGPLAGAGSIAARPRASLVAGIVFALCAPLTLIALAPLAGIAPIMLMVASASPAGDASALEGIEKTIAAHLLSAGYTRLQVAAIMGNIDAESGFRPDALNPSSGAFGLCQWLGGRKAGLIQLAEATGRSPRDVSAQLDWLVRELAGPAWLTASDKAAFDGLTGSDVAAATEFFCRKFERPSEGELARSLAPRVATARRIFDALAPRPGGAAPSSELALAPEKQRAIIAAAQSTPSPGAGLCAAWVEHVYINAGVADMSGNANDLYRAYCTSSDRAELQAGMLIAVPTHPHTPAGQRFGHVGIYLGNGRVISNIGAIHTQSLDSFISYYGETAQVRWGFPREVRP